MNTVPMVDLVAQYRAIRPEIDGAIGRVLAAGTFILGKEVEAFERHVAQYTGVRQAIGVASGTDALVLALVASGIGAGDEVITTPFSFIATSECIVRAGATPVFVDIDEDSLNLDLDAVERAVTTRTRAVLPVHLYGQPVDMTRLVSIARRHGLRVIEDCAQAQGATWQGRQVGSFGDCGCLSFFPSKMVGAYGDGGMVLTDDATVAENVRVLRNHGAKRKYYHETNGFNSRLDALQAAVLDVKLKYLPQWIEARRRVAAWYAEELEGMAGISTLPARPGAGHVYNYYTVRVAGGAARRDALAVHLKEQGIASAVYYPEPLHVQKVYDRLGYRLDDFPRAARASEQVLSLPIYPEMTRDQVKRVTAAIAQFT